MGTLFRYVLTRFFANDTNTASACSMGATSTNTHPSSKECTSIIQTFISYLFNRRNNVLKTMP